MEEPNVCVPRPSPYPPSRLADSSFSLKVTPERDVQRRRNPIRKKPPKCRIQVPSRPEQAQNYSSDEHPLPVPPSLLSAPHVNSSTRLYDKLSTFKSHKQLPSAAQSQSSNKQESSHCTKQTELSSKQAVPSASRDMTDLESMASTKPLQEVNVARHKSRYSDLPPVDISNESFQRLVFKPRKKEAKGKSSKNAATASGGVAAEAPSIMDFFSPELEWDEAAWSIEPPPSVHQSKRTLSFASVPDDAAFTLYRHMQTWKQF